MKIIKTEYVRGTRRAECEIDDKLIEVLNNEIVDTNEFGEKFEFTMPMIENFLTGNMEDENQKLFAQSVYYNGKKLPYSLGGVVQSIIDDYFYDFARYDPVFVDDVDYIATEVEVG